MSLYANRIYHRDRFESFEALARAELDAVQAGACSCHVFEHYQRRGAAHYCAWRALVLAEAPRADDPASAAGRLGAAA